MIAQLQEAFDRIPALVPPFRIKEIYSFGSLPRGIKKSVGDADLILIADMKEIGDFLANLKKFLSSRENRTRIKLFDKYEQLKNESWEARGDSSKWKWPPLNEFVCSDPIYSTLKNDGLTPEWLAQFSWAELCDWSRYGVPNYNVLTAEHLVRRILFDSKRGFQISRVAASLVEATKDLVTEQFVLVWSPDKPNVAQNLLLDEATRRGFIEKEHHSMWEQLQYANVKNTILARLCRYYLPFIQNGVVDVTETEEDRSIKLPSHLLSELMSSTKVSEEWLLDFLKNLPYWIHRSAISQIPNFEIGNPPKLTSDRDVEEMRLKLKDARQRFNVLVEIYLQLRYLSHEESRPTDLAGCLLERVPMNVAPKKFTVSILDEFDIHKECEKCDVFESGCRSDDDPTCIKCKNLYGSRLVLPKKVDSQVGG